MPLYEYDCPRCGTFEVKQRITEEPLTQHDACGAAIQRKISVTSFALKGGGWYADGYRSSKGSSGSSSGGD